ncbi:outer membrane protein assembly factor BamC, partial [Pseudomonas sp.]
MKRLVGLSALAVVISSTSGCSWLWGENGYFRDRGSDYLEARQTAPMQTPPDVQVTKRLDPLLPIPRNVADEAQRSGEYEVPRPLPLQASQEATDYTLQKNGESRWILSAHPPAETWPVAHQFFEDNGFRIADERPQTGEFTTSWQRFDELSAAMAKRLQGAASNGDGEARVRVRIEPGVQRNTSEVYVTTVSRPAGSSADVDFPKMPGNSGTDLALVDEVLA